MTYSEARDIEAVLVNGCFRKRDGKMVPVMTDGNDIGLDQLLKELDQSQKNIRQHQNIEGLSLQYRSTKSSIGL